jgi:HlyD family secretion protein
MKNSSPIKHALLAACTVALLLAGCSRSAPTGRWQGYVEGEYIQVAAPLAGRLEKLAPRKGTRVEAGAPLFTLEQAAELAARREGAERLRQAEARLADLTKGQRPSELAALEARLGQARAAAELAARERDRLARLHESRVVSDDDFDRARLTAEANAKQVSEIEATLATAQLGARPDAVRAAEADVAAAHAALERAEWSVAQKTITAPAGGLVFDTLYREGEFVAAGLPVVSLLPPGNVKVRFFVPEAEFGTLKAGDLVRVEITGRAAPVEARISYLSPQPEYTPPVLYNRENRSKLVFLVEALPTDPAVAADLHPGQPADVTRR